MFVGNYLRVVPQHPFRLKISPITQELSFSDTIRAERVFRDRAHHEPRRLRPRLHHRRPPVLDRQLDALNATGCERLFEDHASGTDRPNLAACLDDLRRGDVLVVLDLDRLGRRAGELITLIDELDHRGVGFRALNSPMDTTTPAGRAFLQIQAAFAEMERNVIRQRVREGVKGGRPRIMTPQKLRYAQSLMADRTRSIPDICRELGDMPSSTLYHYLHANGALKDPGRRLLAP